MKIKKFYKMLAMFCFTSIIVNICSGEVYRERVRVLAVENRFTLVQLGFDISDALNMEYIVFDSTSSDFANNIVYVWNDGINDWVKTTMPAFLNGSLFYNKSVKDVLVITDSLNSIQKFGEKSSWAPKMFVIDKLDFPSILNSINEKYKFTPAQWNIFSEKYNVKVENVATGSSRYAQPLWDFSLPSFTVEARRNSSNADLTPKELQNSSVEVLIVDTEFLSSTDEDAREDVDDVDEEIVVIKTTEAVATNNNVKVVEPVETVIVVEEKAVEKTAPAETNITEIPVVEKPLEVPDSNVVDAEIVSSPVVKPVAKNQVETSIVQPVIVSKETNVVEQIEEDVIEEDIPAAPEVDSNTDQIKIEL